MKIINPSVEYWPQGNAIDFIAKIAHICYMSPDRGHEANVKFYNNLIENQHYSPLRHCTYYYKVIVETEGNFEKYLLYFVSCPYVEIDYEELDDYHTVFYIVTNGQFLYENKVFLEAVKSYEVSSEVFLKENPLMMRYTFCCTTQISTSREFNRNRLSITELSTRYIRFGGKVEPSIVRPWWFNKNYNPEESHEPTKEGFYLNACKESFDNYNSALVTWEMRPEDARGILPLDTMTKVVYTGSIKEWEHCLQMRLLDMTGKAHENCHVLGELIYQELQKLGYKFNEDNNLSYERKTEV